MSSTGMADLSLKDNPRSNTLIELTNAQYANHPGGSDGTLNKWNEPQKYDYKLYNATTREERDAVVAERETPGLAPTEEIPEWAAGAAKYEWKDEYGNVGPAHPELEKILFHNDSIARQGIMFST